MEDEISCKDCGAKLDPTTEKGHLLCSRCGPLRVIKEQWKPYGSGSSIQGVYHVPDYGDAQRPEPRKWYN